MKNGAPLLLLNSMLRFETEHGILFLHLPNNMSLTASGSSGSSTYLTEPSTSASRDWLHEATNNKPELITLRRSAQ